MSDIHEPPNPIELAAEIVSRSGSVGYHGKLHPVSVRLQTPNFLSIQAMAEASGLTRSEMINRVLEAGIYAIQGQLSESGHAALDAAYHRVSSDFLNGKDGGDK